jgi:FkbM family methyltransferase
MLKRCVNAVLGIAGMKLVRADCVYWKQEYLPFGVSLPHDLKRMMGSRPIDVVFDVGANLGNFARTIATEFPSAQIWCFEPFPETFAKLQATAIELSRVRSHPFGFGDRDEVRTMVSFTATEMNSCADRPMYHEYFPAAELKSTGNTIVQLRSLDSFCREVGVTHIALAKIDTEGFDLNVLRGAEGLLRGGRIRFIQTEYYRPTSSPKAGEGALSEMADYLASFDYEFVTSYTEYVDPAKRFFGAHNALFAYAPLVEPSPVQR